MANLTKRIFVLALAVLMVAGMAVGCGEKTPAVTTDAPVSNDPSVTTAPADTEPAVDPNKLSLEEKFGKKNYDGAAVLIITGGDNNWWVNYDVWGPEDSGEILAEALYQRNTEIEDTFDFPVYSIVDVYDIIEYLEADEKNTENVERIKKYLEVYGAKA